MTKCEVAIRFIDKGMRYIRLDASDDALSEFSEFGSLEECPTNSSFGLIVDSRYDFAEVVEYIRNYG